MTMIFVGGGVCRAGKSDAARWVARQVGMPVEGGLDRHVAALAQGGPDYLERGRDLVAGKVEQQLVEGHYGLVEGCWLLPEAAARLRDRYGARFVPLFCGYPQADPKARDAMLMAAAVPGGNWYSCRDRDARLEVLEQEIALSRDHQARCAALGLPYVDVSDLAVGLQDLRARLLDLTRAAGPPTRKEKGRSLGPARSIGKLFRLTRGCPGTGAGT